MQRLLKQIVLFTCLVPASLEAQDIYEQYNIYRNPIRVFLNKFSFTATTGYGQSFYSHQFENTYFYQDRQNQLVFSNDLNLSQYFVGYNNWLNNPSSGGINAIENPYIFPFEYLPDPVNNPALQDPSLLINSDTTEFGFEGTGASVPLLLSLHYAFHKFRIGAGFMYERHKVHDLTPTLFEDQVRSYQPNFNATHVTRWFGTAGYTFYRYWYWNMVAELQIGKTNPGRAFNDDFLKHGLYYNLGVSFENVWSEYFRLIVKPSIDIKNYTINLPDGGSIRHRNPTFFIQVGVSINFPDIPRSPMKSDHTQLKHIYTDPKTGRRMEVRGQPITKKQNPKVGQNHRQLWRNKSKNKRKLNPY